MFVRAHTLVVFLALIAANSPARGEQSAKELDEDLFRAKCVGCHAIACNRGGPKLRGVIGRKAGSVPEFTGYSEAMKTSGLIWSEKTLDTFFQDPGRLVPGTPMTVIGKISSVKERQMLIRFIKRADTSLDLCF